MTEPEPTYKTASDERTRQAWRCETEGCGHVLGTYYPTRTRIVLVVECPGCGAEHVWHDELPTLPEFVAAHVARSAALAAEVERLRIKIAEMEREL